MLTLCGVIIAIIHSLKTYIFVLRVAIHLIFSLSTTTSTSSSPHFQAIFFSLKAVAIFTAEILWRFMKLHFMVFEENHSLVEEWKIVIKFIQ